MNKKNIFGGGNPNSLYTPMSEDEQEVVSRLVASKDLYVHIVGWGIVNSPKIRFGDMRLDIPISITFDRPEVPQLVREFELELRTGAGVLLFREVQSTLYNGQPLPVGSGTSLTMVWHIGIKAMDPALVKAIKPGALGLTSRWIDRETGNFTLLGNTKMSSREKQVLKKLRQGEALVKNLNKKLTAG